MGGLSKSIAEDKAVEILSESDQVLILRTSWIMSTYGKNFAMKYANCIKIRKNQGIFDQVDVNQCK